MKNVIVIILLLTSSKQLFSQHIEIKKTFKEFQAAVLNKDCERLIKVSSFPIGGDIGLARILTSDSPRIEMEKYNYEISKELLNKKCDLMDSIELKVLEQFSIKNESENHGIEYSGCIYKGYLYVSEDNNYFQWSVGCTELLEESIGEYTMIFTFRLIEEKYRLKQIHGAG